MTIDFVSEWLVWAPRHLEFVHHANVEAGTATASSRDGSHDVSVALDRVLFTPSLVSQLAADGLALRYEESPAFWALADYLHTALIVEAGERQLDFDSSGEPTFRARKQAG